MNVMNQYVNRKYKISIKNIKAPKHIGFFYETDEEVVDTIVPFIILGLEKKEKCIILENSLQTESILKGLEAKNVALEKNIASGNLSIYKTSDNSQNKPRTMSSFMTYWKNTLASANENGFPSIRIVCEFIPEIRKLSKSNKMLIHILKLLTLFKKYQVITICLYNLNEITPELAISIINIHSLIIYKKSICKNPHFTPPEKFIEKYKSKKEVIQLLEYIHFRQRDIDLLEENRRRYIESEERYRNFFEKIPISIIEEDITEVILFLKSLDLFNTKNVSIYLEDHPDIIEKCVELVKLNDVNPALLNLMKAKNEDELFKKLPSIFRKMLVNDFKHVITAILTGSMPLEIESSITNLEGENIEVAIRFSLLPISEKSNQRIMISLTDITDKKKMMEDKLAIQKFESIGILAGGIAHDYNNILVAMLGNIELLQLDNELDDGKKELLDDLYSATIRASELTNHLLTFSQGGLPVKQIHSIKEIIKDVVTFDLSGSNCVCNMNFEDPLPSVEIDGGQISQVLNNIIINAIQSMPKGGIIDINVKTVNIRNHVVINGDYLEIAIKDEGCGIPKENYHKMFNLYFTTKKEGSGLGLATSFSIIKNHKGYISFISEEDIGSTFFIYLPAVYMVIYPEKEEKKKIQKTKNKRVLLMDDDQFIHQVLVKIFQKLDITMDSAYDGEEALKKYKTALINNRKYHLVVMDLTIPGGMGGKEAISQLRAIDPNAVAVVSSGYSNDPVMSNYKKYGFDAVMIKPYTIAKLQEVLSELLTET